MLTRIFLLVLASYLILSAAYMVFFLLLVAGLVFRTKETLGLIGVSLTMELLATHPVAGIAGVIVLFIVAALFGPKPDDATLPEKAIGSNLLHLPPPPAEAGKAAFDVILTGHGGKFIPVIKEVRAITNIGLTDARALVESAPFVLKSGVTRAEAMAIQKQIHDAGGAAEIR